MLFALLSFAASAQDKSEGAKLDIPEIVLEHSPANNCSQFGDWTMDVLYCRKLTKEIFL